MSSKTHIGGTSIAPGDLRCNVDWQAQWLMDPIFDGVEVRELINPHRKPENNGKLQNIHTLFRRLVVVDDTPIAAATLHITADDCYKLSIDGEFVGLGPAPAYAFAYPYNSWDVTRQLGRAGEHCLGVHVFYQGMHSLTFPSGDNRSGLLAQLEIEFKDGSSLRLCTDDRWRCTQVHAYEARQVLGYQTAFSEHIDLRQLPIDWDSPSYDDSDWDMPTHGPIPEAYTLMPQVTPAVDVFQTMPERIEWRGPGHYLIDFGSQLTGSTALTVTGEAGHVVEVRHGEELNADGSVRYEMRCNCTYQEFCTLSGRDRETIEFFDYKGFRYIEVLNWPGSLTDGDVWAFERHYPFPKGASQFESDNPLLNDIWRLCRNGVRVGTIDTFLDCPTREKGGFMGDGFVTGMSHLILTGDARILRKFLTDVASTSRYCSGLHSTAPNYVNGELAEYSLLWPVLLEHYYQWTGDRAFVQRMMPVLEGLIRYYADYENDDGLLADVYSHATGRYSVLVDWPNNLRDGYDDPYLMGGRTESGDPQGVVNTMVQGFYVCALRSAHHLAKVADDCAVMQLVQGRSERVSAAVLGQLRDSATSLFVDRNGSSHSALHANVTPMMAGILPQSQRQAVVQFIREKRLSCGVYFSFFVLKALCDVGEHELAYDLITSRDLHSWHSMLEAGATTCMEAWAPGLKWNTSWCHPWSSAPIYMVTHCLMGLGPATPGWSTVRFAPRPPAELPSAAIQLTTPMGRVHARYERDGRDVTYHLQVPEACRVACTFDRSVGRVVVDGSEVSTHCEISEMGVLSVALVDALAGGSHTLVTTTGAG